jgi:tetratricopeptide (TPR) repeat protein
MKLYQFLLILSIIVFTSCKKEYTNNATILKAAALMNTDAVEAQRLLKSIEKPKKLSNCDYAAWCLHYNQVLFKLQTPPISDRLIRLALEYYKGTGMYKYEGLSYFLLGYASENQNKFDDTMEAYLEAVRLLKLANDYNMLGLTYYRIAKLNRMDENYPKAIENFKKSRLNFHYAQNHKNEAYSFREIANTMLIANNSIDSIVYFMNKARKLALQNKDTANYYDASYYLGVTILAKKMNYKFAKELILGACIFNDNSSYYFNKLSIVYSKLNMADSAMYYYNKAIADTTNMYATNITAIFTQDSLHIFNKENAYLAGVYAERLNGNYYKALENYYFYQEFHDKAFDATQKGILHKINNRYNLNEINSENAKLKIANRNKIIIIIILLVVGILVVLKLKTTQLTKKKELLELQIENDKILFEIEKKRMLLLSKLQNKMEGFIRFEHVKFKLPKETDLQKKQLRDISKHFILTKEEWQLYIDEVNLIFNHHIDILTQRFPTISLTDKIVIALISLRVDITNVSIILDMNKNTIYRRRNTIKERLNIEASCDLDKWILNDIEKHLEVH